MAFLDNGVCNVLTVLSVHVIFAEHSQKVAHTVVQKTPLQCQLNNDEFCVHFGSGVIVIRRFRLVCAHVILLQNVTYSFVCVCVCVCVCGWSRRWAVACVLSNCYVADNYRRPLSPQIIPISTLCIAFRTFVNMLLCYAVVVCLCVLFILSSSNRIQLILTVHACANNRQLSVCVAMCFQHHPTLAACTWLHTACSTIWLILRETASHGPSTLADVLVEIAC